MAMGTKRDREQQEELFYAIEQVEAPGHPFYEELNRVLDRAGFDAFCERKCAKFYHTKLGRPSIAPGVYFRALLIGFFEGIGSDLLEAMSGQQKNPICRCCAGKREPGIGG